MNTLKLKVLSILIINSFWQRLGQSFCIWTATSFLGATVLWITGMIGLKLSEIFLLSLVLSSPALVCLILLLYILSSINSRRKRIIFSFTAILASSIPVIAIFYKVAKHYPLSEFQMISMMAPYVVAAEASFFLIARKLILTKS